MNEIRKDSQGREIKSNQAWREECERLRLAVDLLTIELEATRAERDAAINKGMAKIEGTRWLNDMIEPGYEP